MVTSDTVAPGEEGLYLRLLRDAADAVAGAGTLDEALAVTVDLVAERLGFDVCSVYLSDERAGDLVLAATHGLRREAIGQVRMRPGEGLTGLVAEGEQALFTSRADEHPRFKFFPETGEERFRSFGGVPLVRRGRCVGVLTVQTVREYRFPANEVVALQTLAGQV
ncbi:MAG: GAF domain-containing protein, partial [Planctomycetota bacterium]|nr:GAF domain-containing protein [Planctomycetota bacterium]